MQLKVQKWGNSLALRIPKALAAQSHIQDGTFVDVALIDDHLVITPAVRQKYDLNELLKGITAHNIHPETDTGPAIGQEIW